MANETERLQVEFGLNERWQSKHSKGYPVLVSYICLGFVGTTHVCEDNKVTTCDGEFHYNFCEVCGKDMGTENCEEAGS